MSRGATIPRRIMVRLGWVFAIGMLFTAAGLLLTPQRGWSNLLLVTVYITGLGIAGMLFVSIHYIVGASWNVVFRRIPEAMWIALPLGFLLMLGVFTGLPQLYEWADPEHVAHDKILQAKAVWLNPAAFSLRTVIYFAIWTIPGWLIIRNSLRQDSDGDIRHSRSNVTLATLWIAAGFLPFVLSSMDWTMSLEPHWYSTIYGFYAFSGMFTSGLAFIIVMVIAIGRMGLADPWITTSHLHELGRYLFSFSLFWVYIWYSQHMLIWYANLPEETVYYAKRHAGNFGLITVINVGMNWLIPFLILLPRWAKKNEKTMLAAAVVVLIGHWLDLYLLIFPSRPEPSPVFGILEAGAAVAGLGAVTLAVFWLMGQRGLVPVGDPKLEESLKLTVE